MFLTSGLCSPTQYHRMSILYSLFSPYCYQKIKIIYGQWIFSLIFSIIFQISINFNAYFWKIASNFTPLPFVKLRYDPRKSATNIWWTSLNHKILHKLLLLDNLRPDKSRLIISACRWKINNHWNSKIKIGDFLIISLLSPIFLPFLIALQNFWPMEEKNIFSFLYNNFSDFGVENWFQLRSCFLLSLLLCWESYFYNMPE